MEESLREHLEESSREHLGDSGTEKEKTADIDTSLDDAMRSDDSKNKRMDSMKIDSYIRACFDIKDVDIRTYSPLTLAFIGDGIYDLIIRTMIVGRGNTKASQLHQHTSHLVKAHSQSVMIEYMLPHMTEEEEAVYKRGRNAKSPTMAKNATMADYRRATGFEALKGYLYLSDQFERIMELVQIGLDGLKKEEICASKN